VQLISRINFGRIPAGHLNRWRKYWHFELRVFSTQTIGDDPRKLIDLHNELTKRAKFQFTAMLPFVEKLIQKVA
jgi:hypothetical protein